MKKLVVLLIVAAVGALGTKFWIEHRVAKRIDEVIEHAAPFVGISYNKVEASFDGAITVHGIAVTVPDSGERIAMDAIGVKTPDFLYLSQAMSKLEKGEMPNSLFVTTRGLKLDLYADWYRATEQAHAGLAGDMPCVNDTNFYREIGYQTLTIDGTVGYARNADDGTLTLSFDERVANAWHMSGSVEFDAPGSSLRAWAMSLAMGGQRPTVNRAELSYRDESMMSKLLAHCVDNGMSSEDAVNAHIDYLRDWLSGVMVPDEPILAAYRQFLEAPVGLEVTAAPLQPVDLARLNLYAPEDIPDLLNLSVTATPVALSAVN